ncbi:baseplate J/gp47 family protein [Moorella sp. E306M]|uniref:baseplate J/gp47 family protein n=1 Tax=Moorella sp. E306M TaxID=2572683 RepID=UPI0010FFC03B|nr:baseplate J/gp47 family protein [Moorella sp. E306M]GEA17486.1 hypothetical protein E306M_06200 [Moorella sp. E306M]
MAQLPLYLENQTYETILQRMLDALPSDLDKSEGSFIWDALSPAAIELALAAIWTQEVLRRGFVQTTFGEYLDLRAEEYGVTRRPAVAATGTVTFTGTTGTVIPKGTRVSTVSTEAAPAVVFSTTEEAVISESGSIDVPVVAEEPGSNGNVAPGSIILLVEPVAGITSVTNTSATTGGLEEESDDSLRARILELAHKDEGDGNKADYEIWAKEVSGVGYVLVEPLWRGPGTVRVVILDQDGNIPSPDLVAAVQEYLDPGGQGIGMGKAPIGAKVTVEAPMEVNLTITVPTLAVESGYTVDQVKANLEAAAKAYILSVSPGGIVRVKDLEAVIANAPGVLDFGDILINGIRQNVELAVDEKATLAGVIYT